MSLIVTRFRADGAQEVTDATRRITGSLGDIATTSRGTQDALKRLRTTVTELRSGMEIAMWAIRGASRAVRELKDLVGDGRALGPGRDAAAAWRDLDRALADCRQSIADAARASPELRDALDETTETVRQLAPAIVELGSAFLAATANVLYFTTTTAEAMGDWGDSIVRQLHRIEDAAPAWMGINFSEFARMMALVTLNPGLMHLSGRLARSSGGGGGGGGGGGPVEMPGALPQSVAPEFWEVEPGRSMLPPLSVTGGRGGRGGGGGGAEPSRTLGWQDFQVYGPELPEGMIEKFAEAVGYQTNLTDEAERTARAHQQVADTISAELSASAKLLELEEQRIDAADRLKDAMAEVAERQQRDAVAKAEFQRAELEDWRQQQIGHMEATSQTAATISGIFDSIAQYQEAQGKSAEGLRKAQGAFLIAYNAVLAATEIAKAIGSAASLDVWGAVAHAASAAAHIVAAGLAAAQLGGGSAKGAPAGGPARGSFTPSRPHVEAPKSGGEGQGMTIVKKYYLSESMADLGRVTERAQYEQRRRGVRGYSPANIGYL